MTDRTDCPHCHLPAWQPGGDPATHCGAVAVRAEGYEQGPEILECQRRELKRLRSEVARLEGERDSANHWRERWCNDYHASARQSQENWERARDLEQQLSAATAEIERLRAERDALATRLRHLADLASPGQVPEGYEDAVILAAIRERDEARRLRERNYRLRWVIAYERVKTGYTNASYSGTPRKWLRRIERVWGLRPAALSQPAPAPSKESEK